MARTFQINLPIDVAIRGGGKLDELLRRAASGAEEVVDEIARITGEPIKTKVTAIVDADTGAVEKSVKRTTDLTEQYAKARTKASKVEEGSLTNLRQSVNTLKQQRDSIERYSLSAQKGLFGINNTIRTQTAEWTAANNKVKEAERALAAVGGVGQNLLGFKLPDFSGLLSLSNKATQIGFAVQAAVQAFQILNGVVQVFIQRAQQIAGISLALSSFGVSAQGVSDTLSNAKNIALTYGASLTDVEKAYKRLTPTIVASGGSLETTDAVISSLTARTTALGLNTEQSGRYIEAFAQVLGKGRLQSEELNQQFSELDGALRGQLAAFVASEYGITNLEQAMKDGQITAKIFTEFMIEAGKAAQEKLARQLGTVQQSIKDLNPQQIQNIANTLNTISLESLGKTLAPLGQSLASIQLAFSQFFASITSNFPGIARLAGDFFNGLGQIAQVTIQLLIIGFQTIAIAIETTLTAIYGVIDALKQIPGLGQLISNIGGLWDGFRNNINLTLDELTKVNPELIKQRQSTQEYTNKIGELYDKYASGKITVDELKTKVRELREAEAFEQRKAQAKELVQVYNEQKSAIESQISSIDQQITKQQAAFDARKLALEEEVRLIEAPYQRRIFALDEEARRIDLLKIKVLEKYAAEQGAVEQLATAAKAAQLVTEKDELRKLELKRQTVALTQEEANALNAQIAAKKASIASSELELKIAQDTNQLEKEGEAIANNKKKAQLEQEQATANQQSKLKDLKAEEESVIGVLKVQKSELERQVTVLDDKIKKTEEVANATKDVKTQVDAVGKSLNNLSSLKVNITANNARALGGPVKTGRIYQVNERGPEAFLSSSGRLSMINKPAYGKWRAPSSGVVIPAHITEQLVTAQAGYGIAPQSRAKATATSVQPTQNNNETLMRSNTTMAIELGKLSQAVNRINDKDWIVNLNVASGNPLLNRLKRI